MSKSIEERAGDFILSFTSEMEKLDKVFNGDLTWDIKFNWKTNTIDYYVTFVDSTIKWAVVLSEEYHDEPTGSFCAFTILHAAINQCKSSATETWKLIQSRFNIGDINSLYVDSIKENGGKPGISLTLKLNLDWKDV